MTRLASVIHSYGILHSFKLLPIVLSDQYQYQYLMNGQLKISFIQVAATTVSSGWPVGLALLARLLHPCSDLPLHFITQPPALCSFILCYQCYCLIKSQPLPLASGLTTLAMLDFILSLTLDIQIHRFAHLDAQAA